MKQALAVLTVSIGLLAAVGCAPKLVTYPSSEIQSIGPPPQKQVDSPEFTAAAVSLWGAMDAILQFNQTEIRPVVDRLHAAAEKMDHDAFDALVVDGLGKSDRMFLLVLDGEGALNRFRSTNATVRDPQVMNRGELVALSAQAFLKQARLGVTQGRRVLEDGYAYNRSWHEKNLSHLNDKNEASFNNGAKRFHEQEKVIRETRDALAQALRDLLA
ncbi:MAG: hypothetical protein A4C66_07285 [Nitrospira sp. HN-bin3]|uniref:hypothetical protein n=1 Tax=Nitrospira cf. moscoviensis SBR1015 TaxID=96242 RepID=UPI000A0BB8AF|nr:hypothetical protein [Nitrospira cf. moscoviensis SBR1015]OQW45186.1 MAG: hypothetical protein A4C66_07285 [Nitrospira sp. HN-bin3]